MKFNIAPVTAAGIILLTVVNVGLGATLLGGWTAETPAGRDPQEWPIDLSAPRAGATGKPAEFFNQTLARPVFFKTRQPYVAPVESDQTPRAPAAAPINPGFVVAGILIEREVKKAYLMIKGDTQGTWVQEGELFRGWTVQSVDSAGVKLEQQNRVIEVLLYANSKS